MSAADSRAQVRVAEQFAAPRQTVFYEEGTVTAFSGGKATVTLPWGAVQAAHLASYSPVVNDVVSVLIHGDSPLILGLPTGIP